MEILDLRSHLERRVGSYGASDAPPHLPARLAGRIADWMAARRAARRQVPVDGPLVVSIGNLRVGGTGKTPVTMALASDLAERNIAGVILTRGYGSTTSGPLVIEADDPRGADEARLMAGTLAAKPWSVVQSRRREYGLVAALSVEPTPRVLIVEDGFQTGAVGRHFDVLILDAWTRQGDTIRPRTGPVLPFGPYRETARGADRAQVWLLETGDPGPSPEGGPAVTGFARRLEIRPARDGVEEPGAATYGLLGGLARPEGFEAACTEALATPPVLAVRCRDHSPYDRKLLDRILAAGGTCGVNTWITTGKDWIKLADFWPADVPVLLADLSLDWTGRETLPDLVEERLKVLGAGNPEISSSVTTAMKFTRTPASMETRSVLPLSWPWNVNRAFAWNDGMFPL